jgi:hypothetical protein
MRLVRLLIYALAALVALDLINKGRQGKASGLRQMSIRFVTRFRLDQQLSPCLCRMT